MKRQLATALGCAAAVLASGAAGAGGASAPAAPSVVVPYLTHGAAVYVDPATGRPVATPDGTVQPPGSPGVHYYRHP